jgi:hypothetical protein
VKVHLLERFEDVIQSPQRRPALLILSMDHSDKSLYRGRFRQKTPDLGRPLELQPVAGAFQDP